MPKGVPQLVDRQYLFEPIKKPEPSPSGNSQETKKISVNWWNIFFLAVLVGGFSILWCRWEPSEDVEKVSHLSESVRNNDYHKDLENLIKGIPLESDEERIGASPVASNTDSLQIGFSSF